MCILNATTSKRSEEHTSELQSRRHLVCRLLLEKKVAHANPVSIAVAARDNHIQVGVRELGPFRDRESPAVDRLESVRGQEVREVARTADAGHDQDVPRLQLKGVNRRLERAQDREVAATGAPSGLNLGLVRVHLEFHFHATTSTILSAMSREANGSPSYRP